MYIIYLYCSVPYLFLIYGAKYASLHFLLDSQGEVADNECEPNE